MGVQVKFTISEQAAAYLRWFAKNILFESTEHDAARHLMMAKLEEIRRLYRKEEPSLEDLVPIPIVEESGKAK